MKVVPISISPKFLKKRKIRKFIPENVNVLTKDIYSSLITQKEIGDIINLGKRFTILAFSDVFKIDRLRKLKKKKAVKSFKEAIKYAQSKNEICIFVGAGFGHEAFIVADNLIHGIPNNLKIYSCYRRIIPTIEAIIKKERPKVLLIPTDMAVLIDIEIIKRIERKYNISIIVCGLSAEECAKAISLEKKEYPETVDVSLMKALVDEVFEKVDKEIPGCGIVPNSGLELRRKYSLFDARGLLR